MHCRLSLFATLILSAIGAMSIARADQVTMTNGDRLTGTVLHKTRDELVLRTSYGGELHLRSAEIATIFTDEPVDVLLDSGETQRIRLTDTIEGMEVPVRGPDLAAIRYINPTPEESGSGYVRTGHAALAMSHARGNSSNDLYHGDADLVLRALTHRITLDSEGNYGRDGGATAALNWRAGSRYDHFFDQQKFFYVKAARDHDRLKNIQRRNNVGAGYGYQIYEDDVTTLNVRGGLSYVTVTHYDIDSEYYVAPAWGLDLRHQLRAFAGQFFHTEEGTTAFDRQHGTVLQTKTGLRIPVTDQISATTQLNADWESQPAPGRRKLDTTLVLGLGYAFR